MTAEQIVTEIKKYADQSATEEEKLRGLRHIEQETARLVGIYEDLVDGDDEYEYDEYEDDSDDEWDEDDDLDDDI